MKGLSGVIGPLILGEMSTVYQFGTTELQTFK